MKAAILERPEEPNRKHEPEIQPPKWPHIDIPQPDAPAPQSPDQPVPVKAG
ncbi:MAG: hypothetical protein AB1540_17910 [Bdellovibrionota bacterium]